MSQTRNWRAQKHISSGPSNDENECWDKVKPTNRYDKMQHEFKVLQHLQSCPFVPRLLSTSVSKNDTSCWFSMQQAKGKPLPDYEGLNDRVCRRIYEAIEAIHHLGVIHGDLKGDHIFVAEDGNVTIIDFDFAWFTKELQDKSPLGHSFQGSLHYASTLSHLGYRPSFACDFESLGFVVLEWVIGILPWRGLSEQEETLESRVREVGVAKLRWLCSTEPLAVAIAQYLMSGCDKDTFASLPQLLSSLDEAASKQPNSSADEMKRGSAEPPCGLNGEVRASEQDVVAATGNAAEDPLAGRAANNVEVKFRERLSKALKCEVTEEKTARYPIDISCQANDLEALKDNSDWFFQPLQVSKSPATNIFQEGEANVFIEVGAVCSGSAGTPMTNIVSKIDQLHARLNTLLGSDHPLSLVKKVACVGIGVQAKPAHTEELYRIVCAHVVGRRLERPAAWLMAALGRFVFLSPPDTETISLQEGASFQLLSELPSIPACAETIFSQELSVKHIWPLTRTPLGSFKAGRMRAARQCSRASQAHPRNSQNSSV